MEKDSNVCIPVGPNLDNALGGGIPSGTFGLIRTKTGCGKTALCMSIVKNALLQGRRVFFYDVELRMNTGKYFDLEGFDPAHPNFFYMASKDKKIYDAEYILSKQIQIMLMEENRGALHVIDSFSKLVPKEVLDADEVSGTRRTTVPKLQTDWLAKSGNIIRTSDSIVFGIQHLQVDQAASSRPGASRYGPIMKAKGADAFDYEADIVLESNKKPMDLKGNTTFEEEELSGLTLSLKIPKNKRKGPVNTKDGVTTYIKFGKGVWFAREMIDYIVNGELPNPENPDVLMIQKKGGWYNFNTPPFEGSVQGFDKAAQIVEDHMEFFDGFYKDQMVNTYGANYDFKSSG